MFKLVVSHLVAAKINSINKMTTNLKILPCYSFITPERNCRYCGSVLKKPRLTRAKRSCYVYDRDNP